MYLDHTTLSKKNHLNVKKSHLNVKNRIQERASVRRYGKSVNVNDTLPRKNKTVPKNAAINIVSQKTKTRFSRKQYRSKK